MPLPCLRPNLALRSWRVALLAGALWLGRETLGAQELVLDEARAMNAEERAALEAEVRAFTAETGCDLFVKAVTFTELGLTPRFAAIRARRELAPGRTAALILMDRSKSAIQLSVSPELWARYPTVEMAEALGRARMETEVAAIPLEQRLTASARTWMAEVRELERQRQSRLGLRRSEMALALVFLAVMIAGGLFMVFYSAHRRQRRAEESQQFFFPEVIVGQRLGAPNGGGVIAEWPPDSRG